MKKKALVSIPGGLILIILIFPSLVYLQENGETLDDLRKECEHGLQVVLKHGWFGETLVSEVGWRRVIPGWRLDELDFLRGYHPRHINWVALAVNRFEGPTSIDIVSQKDLFIAELLHGIERQPSVTQLVMIDCELSEQSWKMLIERFSNVRSFEVTDTPVHSSMSNLVLLETLQLRNCSASDEFLSNIARLPKLRSVYLLAENTEDGSLSPDGLARFCNQAPVLEKISGSAGFAPQILDAILGDLAFARPELKFNMESAQ